jgi:mono/diheme cytochrome c family protein
MALSNYGAGPRVACRIDDGTAEGAANRNGGMATPSTNAAAGRKVFASKGCVVCHMVNGVGGEDGASLDASTTAGMTNPFDFVANMW